MILFPQHHVQWFFSHSTVYNVPKMLEMTGDGKLNVALSDDPMYAKVNKDYFFLLFLIFLLFSSHPDLQAVHGLLLHGATAPAWLDHIQHQGLLRDEEAQEV